MPVCTKCGSFLKKRKDGNGKYYHCPRHGFARSIGLASEINDALFLKTDFILVGNKGTKKIKLKATFGGINVQSNRC